MFPVIRNSFLTQRVNLISDSFSLWNARRINRVIFRYPILEATGNQEVFSIVPYCSFILKILTDLGYFTSIDLGYFESCVYHLEERCVYLEIRLFPVIPTSFLTHSIGKCFQLFGTPF
ncbi:hypothetical protein KP509_09G080900 [Ceratopteris richardii]|uniref:Uncharacterized protein n=1 Tax=Ceratopteris richardii TaxID=49495 RepID=A0A8T2U5U7_CERRI|nr:hypothetical protein KP509_09G080900 [Ceratopteris richardii]